MPLLLRYALLCLVLLSGQMAHAAGLQVTPIVLDIRQTQKSDGLWLTNTSNAPMDVQVRVFEWRQQNGTDVLNTTDEFVASPPLVKIPRGQKQFVRLVRVGQRAATTERAYRIVVDELPLESATSKGLTFALRYSVPVFIQGGSAPGQPTLQWRLSRGKNGQIMLGIANSGTTRAKLSDLKFTSNRGRAATINSGLFGYALAGSGRQWALSHSAGLFSSGGTFQAVMNGQLLHFPVSPPG